MSHKKSRPVFPKNIIQSFLMLLALVIISIAVIGLFNLFIKDLFTNSEFFIASREFFSYLIAFIVLHIISRKYITSYTFFIPPIKNIVLIILTTICLAITVFIPSYFLLHQYLGYPNISLVETQKISIIALVSLALITPLFEELIIRGVILDGLLKNNHWLKAVIISTILFVLIHFDIPKTPSLILSGLFIGWLYYKTQNLFLTILAHSLNNYTVSVHPILVSNNYENYKYYGEYTIIIVFISFIILLLAGYFLRKSYK